MQIEAKRRRRWEPKRTSTIKGSKVEKEAEEMRPRKESSQRN